MTTNIIFNIAVIDDDPMMREMIIDYFQSHFRDVSITPFTDGEEAFKSDITIQDLVVLDYNLASENKSALNGKQILSELNSKYSHLPVIVLSGQEDPEIAAATIKMGAWDYIIKNENAFQRLGAEVSKIIDRSVMMNELSARRNIVRVSLVIATLLFAGLLAVNF